MATQLSRATAFPVHLADVPGGPEGEFPVLGFRDLAERYRFGPLVGLLRTKLGFPMEVFDQVVRPVVGGYAEFLQSLPAADSTDRANASGAFIQALEVALLALDYRRGQILPRGAAPEVIGEQMHRWTYGVLIAGLLGDAGKTLAGVRVQLRLASGGVRGWDPLEGSMGACGAVSYRVMATVVGVEVGGRLDGLAVQLLNRLVPPPVLAWLAADEILMGELEACLSGEGAVRSGAIGHLVCRAKCSITGGPKDIEVHGTAIATLPPECPGSAPGAAVQAEANSSTLPSDEEYLDDLDDGRPDSSNSKPPLEVPGKPKQPRAVEGAQRFMGWLKAGVSGGNIRTNEPGALVHGVPEGMLLVSPGIFREFAKQCQDEIALLRAGVAASDADVGKWVLRQVLRGGWHLQAEQGFNMLTYQVMRAGRAASNLSGVVIEKPERFVDPVPSVNPALVRVPDSQGVA
ncbi:MAG: TraI domain-containing protein [Burkholderiales bacterium]|nr:TraI domain-containing protein [Burkholderiales bacterium]